jgi:hypothetical protein
MLPINNCRRIIRLNGVLYTPDVEMYSAFISELSKEFIDFVELHL